MKKVIILKKIQEAMKSYVPQFINHFSLSLNRKKRVVMIAESHEKKTKYIHASATADLLHIRIGNLSRYKCGHGKNEAREIDCLCCRELDAIFITSTKIPEREGSILPDY